MGKREKFWPIFLPIPNGFREGILLSLAQMPGLRIHADNQGQLNIRQKGQKLLAPFFSAFQPWRQIAGLAGSRIAKAHGKQGNSGTIIKHVAVNSHPAAQTLPAGIVEGNAGLMHAPARRLANNQNTGRLADLKNRARPQREMGLAKIAGFYCRYDGVKFAVHKSKITHHTFLRQRLILFFRKLNGIAPSRWILDRHGRDFIQALGVNANILQRMGNADFLAQRQNPFQETIEAALDAEIGGGALNIFFNLLAGWLSEHRASQCR